MQFNKFDNQSFDVALEEGVVSKYIHENEKSEILCGLSISCITLLAFVLSSLSTCCQLSSHGWWFHNYYLITAILSNTIGIAFFGTKIHQNGWKALEQLAMNASHLLYFKGMIHTNFSFYS